MRLEVANGLQLRLNSADQEELKISNAYAEAVENWDARILSGLIEGLDPLGPWRLLLLPDHATPIASRTHTSDPVPYLLVDSATEGAGGTYTEAGVAGAELVAGHTLMGRLLGRPIS